MGKVIAFDPTKARENIERAKQAEPAEGLIELSEAIHAAQQSYKSLGLINGGYVGSGLKAEIAQAQRLPEHLARAGRILQAVILRG